jgi:hypothetical protein
VLAQGRASRRGSRPPSALGRSRDWRQTAAVFDRETLPDGATMFRSERCTQTFTRLRPGVLLLRIVGNDRGEFGDAPMDFVLAEMNRFRSLVFFIDLSAVEGVVSRVREGWTEWLRLHQSGLTQVHMLAGSRFVTTTVNVSKELSRTGEMIQIHGDAEVFARAIARAIARPA